MSQSAVTSVRPAAIVNSARAHRSPSRSFTAATTCRTIADTMPIAMIAPIHATPGAAVDTSSGPPSGTTNPNRSVAASTPVMVSVLNRPQNSQIHDAAVTVDGRVMRLPLHENGTDCL